MTQMDPAESLINQGKSDEEVERLTGVSILQILELRAIAASKPQSKAEFDWSAAFAAGPSVS